MIVSSEIAAAIDKRHEHFLTLGPSRPFRKVSAGVVTVP
jgi:hypothetical protein